MSVPPLFKDFHKKTKGFFPQRARDEYDLGQSVNFKTKNEGFTLKGKIKVLERLDQKITFILKRKFGEIEIEETGRKLTAKVEVPKVYKNIDFESKHSNSEVNVTFKYKPENSYWNARIKGDYKPATAKSSRYCNANLSFAVGDDSLNLSVGGEMDIEDKGDSDYGNKGLIDRYKLGFLYTPNKESQYSVIYKPDANNGLEYQFDLYKKMSESTELFARATGKVDTSIGAEKQERPVMYVGGGWNLDGGNRVQGFVNSEQEYGFLYKANVTPKTALTFAVAAYRNDEGQINPRLGYKLEI